MCDVPVKSCFHLLDLKTVFTVVKVRWHFFFAHVSSIPSLLIIFFFFIVQLNGFIKINCLGLICMTTFYVPSDHKLRRSHPALPLERAPCLPGSTGHCWHRFSLQQATKRCSGESATYAASIGIIRGFWEACS